MAKMQVLVSSKNLTPLASGQGVFSGRICSMSERQNCPIGDGNQNRGENRKSLGCPADRLEWHRRDRHRGLETSQRGGSDPAIRLEYAMSHTHDSRRGLDFDRGCLI
jgi:hypothetical protein